MRVIGTIVIVFGLIGLGFFLWTVFVSSSTSSQSAHSAATETADPDTNLADPHLSTFRGKDMNQAELLRQLEDLLVKHIPIAVQQLGIKEPVYSLRIWYFGSDTAGDSSPRLMLPTESLRQEIIKTRRKSVPHYLWVADELDHIKGVYYCNLAVPEVTELCKTWYAQYKTGPGLPPGPARLQPFREMVQRAAKRLNGYDWTTSLNPTPDFIVFAADGSHDFVADFEEMQASVSESRIAELRKHKLLGTDPWWELE